MLKQSWKYLAAVACALAIACNSGKAPAEAALKLAEEAVNSARGEAESLVPDDFKSLSDDLAAAKEAYAKGDYKGALAAAQSIQQKANDVTAKAKAKKDEMAASWNAVAADVPKMVDAIQSRVDILSKSHHLPKGVTKDTLAAAKSGVDSMKTAWGAASKAATDGDYSTAVSQGQAIRDQASQVMQSLGMTSS